MTAKLETAAKLAGLVAGLSLTAALFASPVSARIEAYEFSYKTYELESSAGARAVMKRIERRARQTCLTPADQGVKRVAKNACIAEVTRDLVASINNKKLSAIYAGQVQFAQD